MQTLTEFVDNQIKKYNLKNKFIDDEKLFFQIRIKAQRELQKMGYWKTAKTETIGKAKTRIFTKEQLGKLEIELQPYLEKLATKNKNLKYDKVKNLAGKIADNEATKTDTKKSYKTKNNSFAPIVTRKEIDEKKQEIMFNALFEHFFTPIDTKKLEDLMFTIELTDNEFKKASALEEIKHPEGHLFKRRSIFERLTNWIKRKN